MAKGSKQIKNFAGGLNTYADPRDIKDNEFQALDNVSTDENARIRLSGGFEKKEITGQELQEISFGRPSSQIASVYSDFKSINIDNGDFSLTSQDNPPEGWDLSNEDGSGWVVNSSSAPNSQYRSVINSANNTANNVVNLGKITSSNFTLIPGETYKVSFEMISENPFYYLPEAELPRIRIINDSLEKYLSNGNFDNSIDEFKNTAPNLIPKATSNLSVSTDSASSTVLTWGSYPNWNSNTSSNPIEKIVDSSENLQSYLGKGTNHVLRCAFSNSSVSDAVTTDAIDISSYFSDTPSDNKIATTKKEFYFDFLYNTYDKIEGNFSIYIYDVTNSAYIYSKSLLNTSNLFLNKNMGTNGWEYSNATTNTLKGDHVIIPDSCTSIKLEIKNDTGGAATIDATGFRLYPYKATGLGGESPDATVGIFNGGYTTSWKYNVGYPNTWNQDNKSPYVTSSFSNSKIASLKNLRKFHFSFNIPSSFEKSDDWKLSINAGKWGSSEVINNTVEISDVNLIRTSVKPDVNDSHYILVPYYTDENKKTSIVGYQYNDKTKKYEKFPDTINALLPYYSGKAIVNFTTIFGRTFISNGNFSSESIVYTFFYDNISGYQGYKVISGEQFIPSLSVVQSVSGAAIQDGNFDALAEYLNRSNPNHADKNTNEIKFVGGEDADEFSGGYNINTRSGVVQKFYNSFNHNARNEQKPFGGIPDEQALREEISPSNGSNTYHATSPNGLIKTAELGHQGGTYSWKYALRFPKPSVSNNENATTGEGAGVEDDYPFWSNFKGGNNSVNDPIHKVLEFTSGILDGTINTGGNPTLEGPIKRINFTIIHDFVFGGKATFAFEEWAQPSDSLPYAPWYNRESASGWQTSGSYGDKNKTSFVDFELWRVSNDILDSNYDGENIVYQELLASQRLEYVWDMNNRGDNVSNDFGIPAWGTNDHSDPDDYSWTGNGTGYDAATKSGYFEFSHGELPLSNNYAVKMIPSQYGDDWGGVGGRSHRNFKEHNNDYGEGGILGSSGITSYDRWRLTSLDFLSYDGEYGAINILNLTEDQVGLNVEMGTNLDSGTEWQGTWHIKITTVNYFDEESPLKDVYRTVVLSNTNQQSPTMVFQLSTSIDFSSNMIKEVKIYMRKENTSMYKLQLKVNVPENKMYASGNGAVINGSVYTNDLNNEVLAFVMPRENLTTPNNVDTYQSETGLMESEAMTQEMMTAQWKTATIVNNKMYVGNIMQEGKIYSDRMIKSIKNKFSILPRKNWIDVTVNDGDEIVSLQSYMDKLLQFKHRKLFIINVANEEEGEFLEQTIDGIGIHHDCQITKTIHGICWINERGLFVYDGRSINNLIENKLAISKWKDTISGWDIKGEYAPILGYDRKSDKLIILPTGFSSGDIYNDNNLNESNITNVHTSDNVYRETWRTNIAYVYDFQRQSFTMNYAGQRGLPQDIPWFIQRSEDDSTKPFYKVPPITGKRSDFYYDINGDLSILTDGEISPGKFVYNDIPSATPGLQDFFNDRNMRIITKDYDFGDPSIRKKIHKVYVTFKSTEKETNLVENANLTKDFYASSYVNVYYAIDGTNNWKEFDYTKSKNYNITKGLIDEKSENTTTLTNAITSTDTNITVGSTSNILEDYVIKIGDEHMLVESVPSSTILNVKRGYGYTADDINSYTLLEGIDHDASSTITISNGDWIQAELVPAKSLNNIKSLKLMFAQSKIEIDDSNTAGPQLINFFSATTNPHMPIFYEGIGSVQIAASRTFIWTGVGESNYTGIYTLAKIIGLITDSSIDPGENVTIEMTVSNFVSLDDGLAYIRFRPYAHPTNDIATASDFPNLYFDGNGTQTVEWTRPSLENWNRNLESTNFSIEVTPGCTARIQFSIKSILPPVFDSEGNVPKGFQINDISIIHRTKNVR